MVNQRNISGLLIVCAISIYMLFGNPDSDLWGSFYYCTWEITIIYLGSLVLKTYRDKLLTIVLKIIMGVAVAKLLLSLYSFYDIEIFNKINRSYEAGAFVVGCIIIFLIYGSYGRMAKR